MIAYIKAWIKYFHDLRAYKRAQKTRSTAPRSSYNRMFVDRLDKIDDMVHQTFTAESTAFPHVAHLDGNRILLQKLMQAHEEAPTCPPAPTASTTQSSSPDENSTRTVLTYKLSSSGDAHRAVHGLDATDEPAFPWDD